MNTTQKSNSAIIKRFVPKKQNLLLSVDVNKTSGKKTMAKTDKPISLPQKSKKQKMVKNLKSWKKSLEAKVDQRTSELIKTNLLLQEEINNKSKVEAELNFRNTLLRLETKVTNRASYLNGMIRLIKGWVSINNIAVSLIENNFVKSETVIGYADYIQMETDRDAGKNNCICARLFYGQLNHKEKKMLDSFGSFCSKNGDKSKIITNEKNSNYCLCNVNGFYSKAIVPIKYKEQILGMIHLADNRTSQLTRAKIDLVEKTSLHMGEMLYKLSLEEKISQEQSKLEAFFTHSITPLAVLDKNFNFIRVNKAYAAADKKTVNDFYGHNHFEMYPNHENEEIFRRVVDTKTPFQAANRPFLYPDHPSWGVTYWDWTLFPILDINGNVDFLVFSLKDVTERKLAEEKLLDAEKALQNSRRLSDIGTLAATVAHELRNPLAAIYMAASNIKKKAQNPNLDKNFESIHAKVSESEQIINNLLYYSKLRPPSFAPVSMYAILNECIVTTRKSPSDDIKIARKYQVFKNMIIHADSVQMKELFNNLLSNAREALSARNDKGQIEIIGDVGHNENMASITISDNGEGIPNENLDKIFEPFFSTRSKGTGLGLSVCQEIVKLHHGKLLIKSEKNEGTAITIMLPVKQY